MSYPSFIADSDQQRKLYGALHSEEREVLNKAAQWLDGKACALYLVRPSQSSDKRTTVAIKVLNDTVGGYLKGFLQGAAFKSGVHVTESTIASGPSAYESYTVMFDSIDDFAQTVKPPAKTTRISPENIKSGVSNAFARVH